MESDAFSLLIEVAVASGTTRSTSPMFPTNVLDSTAAGSVDHLRFGRERGARGMWMHRLAS
jgi:hypothetical protein